MTATLSLMERLEQLLQRVSDVEQAYRLLRRRRVDAWQQAAKAGATHNEIAEAAGLSRTTIGDALWIRKPYGSRPP